MIGTGTQEDWQERDKERIDAAAIALLDQFDAVQITVVRYMGDEAGTVACSRGTGNWYARVAATEEALIAMKACMRPRSE